MTNKNLTKRRQIVEFIILFFVVVSGLFYILYVRNNTVGQQKKNVLQIASSVASSLPKEELYSLPDKPEDFQKQNFIQLKHILNQVIAVNQQARFAYLYALRNDKLFFIVDSEPETSSEYSPPGQEFTEAQIIDKKPFVDGCPLITGPVTDRWGTWVSVEVPIKDAENGRVIAVLGMDYDARTWKRNIWFEIIQSVILAIIILILTFVTLKRRNKNERLKREITRREIAEEGLKRSESEYRLLFGLNPQPMLVYDLESMKILAVNLALTDKYGYSEAELLQMTILDLKSSDEFIRLWKNLIQDPNSFQRREMWNHRLKNGNTIQVEVHSHNLDFRQKNARLVLLLDISERLNAEKALKENELQISNLVSNLPGIVYRCALDENYTMDFISEGCTRITGYTPDEFTNLKSITFNSLILPEYQQYIWNKWQKIINDKDVFEAEYPIKTASGEIKWLWERGCGVFNEKGKLLFLEGYVEDITQRKLIEEKHRQSESNLTRTIEESPFGIRILSEDGTTLFANTTLLWIFGVESLLDFNQIPVSSWFSPESYSEYLDREERRRNGETIEPDYEVCIINKINEVKYLQVHRQQILWNGTAADQIIYQDITARKLAEDQLKKLSRAVEQNPVSVVITNAEGIIEYVNPKFTVMTGYEPNEAIGKNPRILKSGKMSPEFYSNLWKTISSGEIWTGEFINRNKSGEFYWANKSISPIIDEHGKITHFVAIGEEITEKKRNEAELIRAKEKAEEKDRLKSAFLANISHEIRTPMNGILGFAELLKEPDLSPENQQEFLNVIEKSGQRMLNIINDLIDISKIEAGETTVRVRDTNLNKLLAELHSFFLPEASKKGIEINYHCPLPDERSRIKTDRTKLGQVLTNLIKNAIKFTVSGSINFGYSASDITFTFYITDTGPGIHPDQIEMVFERFRQGTLSTARNQEGAGLGLAICKAYVELLGGKIWVKSELGKGSTFYFELPFQFSE